MSEEQKKPTNITSEELYRQVWATPMSRLGMQYGISGNGLKKICDRLNVSYPPRGYWAKLGAGKSVRQTPLLQPLAGTPLQATITPTPPPAAQGRAPELDPDTAERLREASDRTSGIAVPISLTRRKPSAAAGRRRKGAARNVRDKIKTATGGGGSSNLPRCGMRRGWPGISSTRSRSNRPTRR
jgi:hypothetical protein